ncbi:hypothetical protein MASR1M65_04580 [Saprospiraceae bacterium]
MRDDRHRSGRKTLAQRAKSGDLEVKRQDTWGMSDDAKNTLQAEGADLALHLWVDVACSKAPLALIPAGHGACRPNRS